MVGCLSDVSFLCVAFWKYGLIGKDPLFGHLDVRRDLKNKVVSKIKRYYQLDEISPDVEMT